MAESHVKQALREHLEQTGTAGRLIAAVRTSILTGLQQQDDAPQGDQVPEPEARLVLELLREFLAFQGLRSTLSVLMAEAGLPEHRPLLTRGELAQRLGIAERGSVGKLPLVFTAMEMLQQRAQAGRQAATRLPTAPS